MYILIIYVGQNISSFFDSRFYLFNHSFICLFIPLLVYLFIYSFIYSVIY